MALSEQRYFYLRGTYPHAWSEEIRESGLETLRRANRLLEIYRDATGADLEEHGITSGWRPPMYNATVPGAARKSHHMTGKAVDLADEDGSLDEWCMDNLNILEELGLWMEAPAFTKGWAHFQIVPPRSGRRVFNP